MIECVEALFWEESSHVMTCSSTDVRDKPLLGRAKEFLNDILVYRTVLLLFMEIFEGLLEDLLPFLNVVDLFYDVIVSFGDTDDVPFSRPHNFLEEISSRELIGHFKDN